MDQWRTRVTTVKILVLIFPNTCIVDETAFRLETYASLELQLLSKRRGTAVQGAFRSVHGCFFFIFSSFHRIYCYVHFSLNVRTPRRFSALQVVLTETRKHMQTAPFLQYCKTRRVT